MRIRLTIFLMMVLLSAGCASVDKIQAEAAAVQFVGENVKFFSRQENSTLDLPQYTVDSITSYQESKGWAVAVHVSAKTGNETKKNDLLIRVDRKGKVTELNGKKVPE